MFNCRTVRPFGLYRHPDGEEQMPLKFKKLKQNRIFQSVVDQIQAAVIDGSLQPGDMLPSEMKLKEMFDTSRGTIREALRVLEQKGLVEIKTGAGGGAAVKAVDTEKIAEGLDLLIQYQKVSLDHLAEFREEIEGIVAALAAERASDSDLLRLKQYPDEFSGLLRRKKVNWKACAELDVHFHVCVARIAGNPVFEAVLQMVHENILGHWERFSLKDPVILQENEQDIRDMVTAIASGEADNARALARHHVRKFKAHLEETNHQIHYGEKGK